MLPFVQIVYWLALSTWFGGVLFVALATPIVFRTVRESNPILPTVLSVNLEGQHGTLLAGSIIANILERLTRIEYACAAALLLALSAQWALIRPMTAANLVPTLLRSALYIGAVVMVVYHSRVLWPRMMGKRQEYLDHADEPDIANPARDDFDRYQRESVTVLTIVLAMLLGIVLFSASIPTNSPGGSGTGTTLTFPGKS